MMPQGHTCGLAHQSSVVPILVVAPIVVSFFQLHQYYFAGSSCGTASRPQVILTRQWAALVLDSCYMPHVVAHIGPMVP
jgi:hypothetical protein